MKQTMKQTINAKELRGLGACKNGYDRFYEAHGDKDVSLLDALESNGVSDVMWLIRQRASELNKTQLSDLINLSINLTEVVLPFYERDYPDCRVKRKAVDAARACLKNPTEANKKAAAAAARTEARTETVRAATAAARAAAAATTATIAAARTAAAAARAAARAAAARAASNPELKSEMSSKTKEMLKKWEGQQ